LNSLLTKRLTYLSITLKEMYSCSFHIATQGCENSASKQTFGEFQLEESMWKEVSRIPLWERLRVSFSSERKTVQRFHNVPFCLCWSASIRLPGELAWQSVLNLVSGCSVHKLVLWLRHRYAANIVILCNIVIHAYLAQCLNQAKTYLFS
jgi:hypothetical protein